MWNQLNSLTKAISEQAAQAVSAAGLEGSLVRRPATRVQSPGAPLPPPGAAARPRGRCRPRRPLHPAPQGQLSQAREQITQLASNVATNVANNVLVVEPAAARAPARAGSGEPGGPRPGRSSSSAAQQSQEALLATAALLSAEGAPGFDDVPLDDSSNPPSPSRAGELRKLQHENAQLRARLQQVQDAAAEALGEPPPATPGRCPAAARPAPPAAAGAWWQSPAAHP
jgi:hypothetical protein